MSTAALGVIIAGRNHVRTGWQTVRQFIGAHPVLASSLAAAWVYLGLQAVILPPANYASMTYNLARVLLFEQDGSLFPSSWTTTRQFMHPVGSDILAHLFLRFGTDYGVGVFSFLAYPVIGFGTYALTKRHAGVTSLQLPESFIAAGAIQHPSTTYVAYLLCINLDCDTVAEANPVRVLWKAASRPDIPKGALLSLRRGVQ